MRGWGEGGKTDGQSVGMMRGKVSGEGLLCLLSHTVQGPLYTSAGIPLSYTQIR